MATVDDKWYQPITNAPTPVAPDALRELSQLARLTRWLTRKFESDGA